MVNSTEGVVGDDTLRDIEAVRGNVSRVVVWEEARLYDGIRIAGVGVEVGGQTSSLLSVSAKIMWQWTEVPIPW